MGAAGSGMAEVLDFGSGTPGGVRWALRLLGPFALTDIGAQLPVMPTRKRERLLLAYLALSPNCQARRRKLAALFWDEADENTSLDNLRVCLWSVRKALGDADHRVIASFGEDIVLDVSAFDVDVLAFRRFAATADAAGLQLAANLYTGEFLDGLSIDSEEFESWRRDEVMRLREQAIDVFSRLMARLTEAGDVERAIGVGARILSLDPLHEPVARQLMRLYADSGRRGAAIQLYRTLADALKNELDVRPEAETRSLLATIGRGEESAAHVARSPEPLPAPRVVDTSAGSVEPVVTTFAPAVARPTDWQRPLKWAIPTAAAAALIAVAMWAGLPRLGAPPAPAAIVTTAATPSASSISVAVLPFANISGDANQEFFSDGVTEEITAALARIPNLSVVARTSAFQFRNQNRDISAIGRQLHASHVIEGSVRKAGDRVRITVHLVDANDGRQLWSEEYDRRLTDIFAIQEEIARMIAASLHKPLGLKEGENLVNNRPADSAIHDEFLRAKALWRKQPASTVASILEKVVVGAPDYAPAWSLLALAYLSTPYDPGSFSGGLGQWRSTMANVVQKADTTAHRALELDPQNADAWLALARIQQEQNNYARADELNVRALALDPDNAGVLMNREQLLRDMGYLNQALSLSQRAVLLEPYIPAYKSREAVDIWLNGRSDEAIKIFKAQKTGVWLPQLYAEQGHYRQAAEMLETNRRTLSSPDWRDAAARLLRNAPARPADLPEVGRLYWVYFFVGAPEHMLDWNEEVQKTGYWASVYPLWAKAYVSMRKTQRFKNYVRSLGFVDYWKQHGWPDLCHPVGTDDFECD